MEIGLCLGSNLGDRLGHFREAKRRILSLSDALFVAQSPVYETEPVDVAPEHAALSFLNAILIIERRGDATALPRQLRGIEEAMGRRRGPDRNSPRPMDVDIIYAGGVRISTPDLTVPHPRWSERRFVVQPLADVRPDLRLPGETRTVRQVLESLPSDKKVSRFAETW